MKLFKWLMRKRQESNLPSQSRTGFTGFEVSCPLGLKHLQRGNGAFLVLAGLACVPNQSHADEFIYSGDKLVDYLIVRPQTSDSRFPVAVCRVPLYDIPAGTSIVVNAWSNVTNDTSIDNVGHTCELHLCDPDCVYGSEASRFDKLGGVAQGGGSNVTRDMHHDDTSRYGRITLRDYRAVVTVELQCRAYNKRAVGNRNRLTVDGCGIDVQEVQ